MFAVLFLSNFRLQTALRWRDELLAKPVAIVDERSSKGTVLEYNQLAENSGVRHGIPGVQALARCPSLVILPGLPEEENASQSALLELAHSLSPEVESTGPGCCTINLKGIKMGDGKAWCITAIENLAHLKLTLKIGIAPNPDLAYLAAQKAEQFLIVQSSEAFLRDLAVAAIEPSPQLEAVLHGWGIHTLGQLTSLPRGELGNRLGPEADRLWKRAAGKTERLLELARPIEEFCEAFDFEFEIETTEPLYFILRRFLNQLCIRLEMAHRVAARLFLTLPLEGENSHRREFTIPVPTKDEATLFRIITTHLDGLQLEERICGIRLKIEPALPDHQQCRLFDAPLRDANRFAETIARLVALVGPGNVGVAKMADTHRPECFSMETPQFHQSETAIANKGPIPAIGLPLKRFRPPFPVQVQVLNNQPARIVSEKAHGRVIEALGPYRASGSWWDGEQWSSEEWDVEIAGEGLFRLHREKDLWLVEGCYDAELR